MLHIINGDSTASTLKQSDLEGEKFVFREVLIYGPTPSGLGRPEWRAVRANHLSESYGIDLERCEHDLLEQDQVLDNLNLHNEVILWFEHDLFCQLNLLYLLHQFARSTPAVTQLSLINIGSFRGKENFRGLGELNAEELVSLFPARQRLTRRELDLGATAWEAYTSPDPSVIEALLTQDTSALPFLRTALRAHLQRFPSLKNGLGKIENSGLDLIERGLHKFNEVFPRFVAKEQVYGLGDTQFWISLQQLASVRVPLVSLAGSKSKITLNYEDLADVDMKLTDMGRAVLNNEADHVEVNGIDGWLGGVQLRGHDQIWRWDTEHERLAFSA
jgi:hypothetical protein